MPAPLAAAPVAPPLRRRPVPPAQRLLQLAFRGLGPVAPDVMAGVAERLFYTPRRHEPPAREREWLAHADPFFLETAQGPLAAWTWGVDEARLFPWVDAAPKETVLLVHGWEGRGGQLGAFAAPLVEKGFRVVAVDMPAHGRSPGTRTDLPSWAAALHEIVAQLLPVRAVVAHSMGAGATVIALSQGLPVDAVALLAPPCSLDEVVRRFAEVAHLSDETQAAFRARFEARFGEDVYERLSGDALAGGIDVPGLIVHDVADREVDVREGQKLAAAWRGSRLVLTAGLGHTRLLRERVVVDEVLRFLDEEERRRSRARLRLV